MKRRKRVLQSFGIILVGVLLFCGCSDAGNDKKVEREVEMMSENQPPSYSVEDVDLDSLELSAGVWRDNSLDLYSATSSYELKRSYPKDDISGGASILFAGNTRGFWFKKHLSHKVEKCWDEISYVTAEGNYGTKSIEFEEQVWGMGPVAGTDDCLMEMMDWNPVSGEVKHYIIVADRELNQKQNIHLSCLDGEEYIPLNKMGMDACGNIHFIYAGEERHYMIADNSGNLINDYILTGSFEHLYFMPDGQMALKVQETQNKKEKYSFLQFNMDTRKIVKVAEFEKEGGRFVRKAVCPDKDTILFADSKGVYKGSPDNVENASLLYEWIKHGMQVTDVWELQYLENGRISLICEENGKMYYVNLEPTKEEVPIQKITFAIPSHKLADYQKAVVTFNKKYPAYTIELKADYDETALLTELMAGRGPVLIDTALTGFANQKELWLPLDKILEKLELSDKLLLPAIEQGCIDGKLYGMVDDFLIETVITVGGEERNWTYEELATEILENQKLESLTDSISCDNGWSFVGSFLIHGEEDNYFYDASSKTTHFQEPQMRELLEAIKNYYSGTERYEAGEWLEEGRVLCNPVYITRPEQLALYRLQYGENLQYSGYPTKDGGKHFLLSDLPITIRKNATKEEITVACLFFQLMLSYEVQSEALANQNKDFSVRKDVLEEQLAAVNEETNAYANGFEECQLGDGVDNAKDKETFYKLLESAEPLEGLPSGLRSIFAEELLLYFNGEITVDMVLEHLGNRVQLYLDEN